MANAMDNIDIEAQLYPTSANMALHPHSNQPSCPHADNKANRIHRLMDSITTAENGMRDQKLVIICKLEGSINWKGSTDDDNNELDNGGDGRRDWEGSTMV